MATIGLAAAIEELRQELYETQDRGTHEQFAFEIQEAQLELLLELRDDVKARGNSSSGWPRPARAPDTRRPGRTS